MDNKVNCTITPTTWCGQDAWALESDAVRTVVIPQLGAKLVSLFDKRSQQEWLVGPGERLLKPIPYGASFVDQDMSGWDEMFPTIVACDYPRAGQWAGAALPDHGEVWALPWALESDDPHRLKLAVHGRALPYRLTRSLGYSMADRLEMHYELINLGGERMAFLWSAHPQFVCTHGAQIVLPPHVETVCNTLPAEWGWGEPERRFNWPEATDLDGKRVRIDHSGPAARKQARKLFVTPETPVEWAGLIRQPARDWLRLEWDTIDAPYLGIWVDEGAISREAVVALEPMTGYYDSLATAWAKRQVALIEAGATKTWRLSVQLGAEGEPFPA